MRNDYMKNGFMHLKNFFSAQDMEDIVKQVHDVFAAMLINLNISVERLPDGRVPDELLFKLFDEHYESYVSCMKAVQNLPAMFSIGGSCDLLDAVRDAGVERPAFSSRPILTLSSRRTALHEGHWKTPAHQDWRSIQGSLNSVVVWVSLDKVGPELGQLEVIPGSHLRGLLPAETDDWYMHITEDNYDVNDFQAVPTDCGDVLIFSTFLIHRSGENLKDNHRYSMQFRFNDLAEKMFIQRRFPTAYVSNQPQEDLIDLSIATEENVRATFDRRSGT